MNKVMEFKGTKGKWDLRSYTRGNNLYSNTYVIKNGLFKEHDANALLISKAPELLEMLKIVCTELYKTDNELATSVKELIKQSTTLHND